MARTSSRRIPSAQQFVKLGFGEAIDDDAPFYSHHFLTQELTTTEAQAVIPVLSSYNNFDGNRVSDAIGKFKGRVSGWKFGAAQSPLLLVVLAPWSHQVEDTKPGGPSGTKFTDSEVMALAAELKNTFVDQLHADSFEQYQGSQYVYAAWWG